MKQFIHVAGVFLILLIAILWVDLPGNTNYSTYSSQELTKQLKDDGILPRGKNLNSYNQRPSDWFYRQRAYPYDDIPREKQLLALKEATAINKLKTRSGEIWGLVGPSNIPGRITDIAVDNSVATPIIYVASAAGGVFKSVDNGANWIPIFDDAGVLPIGAIALNPQNTDIIYVGTGEANSGADTYEGNGIYKSIDGGGTWTYVGLSNSYHIGRLVVDPLRPDTIYAAVGGKHFGALNSERGLYRSDDGGATWVQKLYVSDSTSCIDLALHPSTGTVFACMWEKVRFKGDHVRLGGITSGLHRSTDFGDNWTLVSGTGNYPAQASNISRIGITVDPSSNTVYSSIIDLNGYDLFGVYKSTDLGLTWTQTNDAALDGMFGGFGWYFGQIRVAPGNPNLVYALGVQLYISDDGGSSWYWDGDGIHVDHHALSLLPNASFPGEYFAYEGCDGGVNYRAKESDSWSNLANMPNTQFYAIHIDESNPYSRYYGGTQDNGSMRTLTPANLNSWEDILGGDGFYCLVDYTDEDVVYAEYQNGYLLKSTNGTIGWGYAMDGIDYNNDRHNWNTPIAMSPGDHNVLYYGSQYLYKTEDGADNWTPVSGDLSSGPYPTYPSFGTITTIDVGHQNNDVIYVGTDDGNIWVTQNGGTNWTQINTAIPDRWITRVTADPRDDAVVYATISGYDWSEPMPHVYRSTNYGADWVSISGDLPDSPVHDVIPDPHDNNTVWIGTDFGVYITEDMGSTWLPFGSGLPMAPVHDIDFNSNPSRIMIAGTHGRSLYRTVVPCPDDTDTDGDGIMDACDNCPITPNQFQEDPDHKGHGSHCDFDLCGNANFPLDNAVNILDVVYLINYKYKAGPAPISLESSDVNSDLGINILDVVYLINYKYKGGPEPVCP